MTRRRMGRGAARHAILRIHPWKEWYGKACSPTRKKEKSIRRRVAFSFFLRERRDFSYVNVDRA